MNKAVTRLEVLGIIVWGFFSQFARGQTATVNLGIVQPTKGSLAGDALSVIVSASSTFEISKVVGEVEGRQITLAFNPSAYGGYGQLKPGWVGVLSLSGLARGPHTLTATATDAFNNSAQGQVTFIYDRKPSLTVTAPLEQTVARPQLRVAASCADDDPAGCSLKVGVATAQGGSTLLASAQNNLDQIISLAEYEGTGLALRFEAIDSAGQTTALDIPVWVESSPRLSEVESVTGGILQVQPDRILFRESRLDRTVLKIRQRITAQDTVVMDQAGRYPQYGYLTPNGAIFMEQSGDVLSAHIYDDRDGTLVDLGFPNSAQSLIAKGNYAIWSNGTTLFLRDLVAGTSTPIAGQSGNWKNDVALDGDVVYWGYGATYNIFRYQAGVTTQVTTHTTLWNVYPLTDGNSVIYRKQDPCCGQQRFGLYLHDGTHEIELAALALRPEPAPYGDYQIDNGWVAFTRLGTGGQLQVWTRSPIGQEKQIAYYGDSSHLSALASNGQVMFLHGRRYLSVLGPQALDISSPLGSAFWQSGHWWIALGRSLFRVNTESLPTISDLFTTTTGQFGFQVNAADGQTIIVQTSEDLIDWETLQTTIVMGTSFIFKDNASPAKPHRFYRVLTPVSP